MHDIKGALTVEVLVDYLLIWDMVEAVILRHDVQDHYKWKLTQHGSYSSKSAYEAFFVGSIKFGPWRRIWRTWAPPRCKFFVWLVSYNRLWTADRLAKRNLPHPEACPFCEQEGETINHLMVGCVFVREVWNILGIVALGATTCNSPVFWMVEENNCSSPKGDAQGPKFLNNSAGLGGLEAS